VQAECSVRSSENLCSIGGAEQSSMSPAELVHAEKEKEAERQ